VKDKLTLKESVPFLPKVSDANTINPLNAGLNPICHLLALLGAHHILHISRVRVNNEPKTFFVPHRWAH